MSIRRKVLAAAAVMTLAGAASATGTIGAQAATPSCYEHCIDLFSPKFGSHADPSFVLDAVRQRGRIGQPVTLYRAANSDPGEDFHIFLQGRVSQFAALGLVSSALALHYGGTCALVRNHRCVLHYRNDWAYVIEFAPLGVPSGLCLGVAKTAVDGTRVVLARCGASTRTTWVVDANASLGNPAVPLINGSDTNVLDPFVLNYPGSAAPMLAPAELTTWKLQWYPNGGVFNNQVWSANFGPL